jgi:hypothetical protein
VVPSGKAAADRRIQIHRAALEVKGVRANHADKWDSNQVKGRRKVRSRILKSVSSAEILNATALLLRKSEFKMNFKRSSINDFFNYSARKSKISRAG